MSGPGDYKKFRFRPASRSDGEKERETYYLAGPEDFDEYLARIRSGEATAQELDEFTLRMMQHFVDAVCAGAAPRGFVMEYLANQFYKVLHGGRWEDELPFPWSEQSVDMTRAEWRGLSMACDIENARRGDPSANVTEIIREVAEKWGASYESARDHYYARRESFSRFKASDSE